MVLCAAACRVALCVPVTGVAHIYTPRATSITHTAGSRTMRYYRLHVFYLCSFLKNQSGTEERQTAHTPHTLSRSHLDQIFRYPILGSLVSLPPASLCAVAYVRSRPRPRPRRPRPGRPRRPFALPVPRDAPPRPQPRPWPPARPQPGPVTREPSVCARRGFYECVFISSIQAHM